MNVLHDTAQIVEPLFDDPVKPQPASTPLSIGSRVSLIYRGVPLPVQVEAIERLGTMFVGRIRGGEAGMPLVRFRPRDVASFD
jgi:hypothetical protein